MKLSILVIFYNMRREAARTLYSLSPAYQQDVDADAYEVIAIDNGSSAPLDPASVTAQGASFRYQYHDTDSPSPVAAINAGAAMATGTHLAVIIDGARMASPGLIARTFDALAMTPSPVVAAVSAHLGPEPQRLSRDAGYCEAVEDDMLAASNWQDDGYALFDIGTLAPSSRLGYLGGFPPECSWIALPREMWDALGGFDEGFASPGGGLAAFDFRDRAVSLPGAQPVMILGEAVFHQIHDGAATGTSAIARPMATFTAEYEALRGKPRTPVPCPKVLYVGQLNEKSARFANPSFLYAISQPALPAAPAVARGHAAAGAPILITGIDPAPLGAIARYLAAHGAWLGQSLDTAGINRWLDALVARKAWMTRFPRDPEITRALTVFGRAMTTGLTPDDPDAKALLPVLRRSAGGQMRDPAIADAVETLATAQACPADAPFWACAAPLGHLILPQMLALFPDMRVIHVVDDPVAAAFGTAHAQTRAWGSFLLGERVHFDPVGQLQTRALDYWLAAHTRALALCAEAAGDQHLILRAADLTEAPFTVARHIANFAGLEDADPAALPPVAPSTRAQKAPDLPKDMLAAAHTLLSKVPRHA